MTFQVCNVEHPNSPVNTCAFCVFEAPDNITNLRIALKQFRDKDVEVLPKGTMTKRSLTNIISHLGESRLESF